MKSAYDPRRRRMIRFTSGSVIPLVLLCALAAARPQPDQPELNDVHFHLTNYIQEGTDIHDFLLCSASSAFNTGAVFDMSGGRARY
jgi:hypothetical protein